MRKLKKVLLTIGTLFVVIAAMLYFLQEKLIFLPSQLSQDYAYEFDAPFDELFIDTPDGARLNGIHFRNATPKGAILFLHGNAGDLSRWGEVASYYTQYNYDVVVMDYRTYGKSTGKLSEENFYSDAQLFYDYIKAEQFPEENILVYGRSLGTGIAAYIAANNSPSHLILETPYYNLAAAAKNRFPIFPVEALLRYRFPTNEFLENVSCPVLILQGTEDDLTPYEGAKKLAGILPSDQVEFVTIPGGEHGNLMEFEQYRDAIAKVME